MTNTHPLKAERSKPLPRTGESRQRRRALSIDLLPMDVLEAIKLLRSQNGFTWREIERLSSLPYSPKWRAELGTHGFIDWDELPPAVVKAFPKLRLPHSNLHRWYDLQVEQKQKEALVRAEQSRVIAQAFAEAGIDKMDDAVMNALRDLVFGMMLQLSDDGRSLIVAPVHSRGRRHRNKSLSERRGGVVCAQARTRIVGEHGGVSHANEIRGCERFKGTCGVAHCAGKGKSCVGKLCTRLPHVERRQREMPGGGFLDSVPVGLHDSRQECAGNGFTLSAVERTGECLRHQFARVECNLGVRGTLCLGEKREGLLYGPLCEIGTHDAANQCKSTACAFVID